MGPQGLRILLVTTSPVWSGAVRTAAETAGAARIDAVSSGDEAISRLVTTACNYSHVLVQANAAGPHLHAIYGLTCGEVGTGTSLAFLGSPRRPASHIPRVSRPTARSVTEVLHGPHCVPPTGLDPDCVLRSGDALESSMLEVRYQPLVRIADGACVCLEILARLNHPAHGVLPPFMFIPRLEKAGRAAELTSLVASIAFGQVAELVGRGDGLDLALNVPLDVILDAEAMSQLDAHRVAAGIARERIVLELTESRPVDDFDRLGSAVHNLRTLGYGVAIDDLGPAVPQQSALLGLPFTAVKLDAEVIRGMDGAEGRALLTRLVATAKANGLTVIAEGVEDRGVISRLASTAIDQVQGFLIARPLPAAALPVWLEAWPEKWKRLDLQPGGALLGDPDHTSL